MTDRRKALQYALGSAGAIVVGLPARWSKPALSAVILPAHAQTSCSGFTTTVVNESLNITVTATEIQGPIVVTRTNPTTFSGGVVSALNECRPGENFSLNVEFSGVIDSAANQISGDLIILQTCGTDFVCEQISTFVVIQSPVNSGVDEGSYSGTVTGTLRCCDDFM
jgi:hypothetical protein